MMLGAASVVGRAGGVVEPPLPLESWQRYICTMTTPAKKGIAASRRRSSPYFDTSTRHPCSADPNTRGGSRSRHFASAASPALQSAMTTATFVDTLGGRRGAVVSAFMSCPAFSERYRESNNLNVEEACRHLCPRGCFYWSYAPTREWHALREAVRSISGTSPNRILNRWRCVLTVDNESDNEIPAFQVQFISPEGTPFDTVASVLKALNCASSIRSVKSSRISATSRATVRASTRGRKRKRSDSKMQSGVPTQPPPLFRHQTSGLFASNEQCHNDKAWSPFGLLEELFANDPWKMLLSTIFLNRTTRRQVDSVLYQFLERWPTAQNAADADVGDVLGVVTPLGIKYRRSAGIIRFSKEYVGLMKSKHSPHFTVGGTDNGWDAAFALEDADVLNLYGCGRYALSAYRIFILGDFNCSVHDHALHYYVDYKQSL